MSALIDKLFPQDKANAIRKLWEDKSSRLLLEREIGKCLVEHEGIIEELPLTQLMLITSLSPFASSARECYDVAEIIYWGIKQEDILPRVTEHFDSKELAYRCLISLGLFKKVIISKCERYGAPSPKFYRGIGVTSFKRIGKENISSHFVQWESFMSEFFV